MLRLRLPLLVFLVLVPVVAAFLWTANRQLERALLTAGGDRAQASAAQVADLVSQNTARGLVQIRRLAGAPAVRLALVSGDESTRAAAREALQPLAADGQPPVVLLDDDGRAVVVVTPAGAPNAPTPALPSPLPRGVGPFRAVDGGAVSLIVEDVVEPGAGGDAKRRLGALVVARRLRGAPNAALLSRLVGAGALVAMGSGEVWTDFTRLVSPPPAEVASGGVAAYRTPDGEARLGAVAPIADTPWAVLVDLPQRLLLAPARAVLRATGAVAAVFLALGIALVVVLAARADQTHGELEARVRQRTTGLEAANRELDRFFSVSRDLFCIADFDGYFRRVNDAWHDVLGWETAELTSTPYIEFVHPDDRQSTATEAGRLEDGRTVLSFENRYRHKNGSYRWLRWVSVPEAEERLIYASARDVTHERELAAALETRVGQLADANRELESFSYSVSHDLRAPLRHITGFAALLERSAGDTLAERDRRYLTTITGAADRMGRLIDDLLEFSRMGRSSLSEQRVDLQVLVDDARREMGDQFPGRRVEWVVGPLPTVTGDREMLRVVFTNLLSNAVKYSGPRVPARVEIGVAMHAGASTVFVRDNGVGFDPQYAHKLFGVFQRLHSSDEFEGTGIGLATVRRIVHRHGGAVWAEGAVDRGATFYVSLPSMNGGHA